MKKQYNKAREFNRIYSNLIELCKRVYDDENVYPKNICAKWFVTMLHTLLKDEQLKSMLDEEQIKVIHEASLNVRKTKFIENVDKRTLTGLIKELKAIKYGLECQNNSVQQA